MLGRSRAVTVTLAVFGAALLGACGASGATPRAAGLPFLMPIDFRSAFTTGVGREPWRGSEGVLALRIAGGHPDAGPPLDLRGPGSLRLVRLDTGADVPGAMRAGLYTALGVPAEPAPVGDAAISFVPQEALSEGWYVLVADVSAWAPPPPEVMIDGHYESDRLYARLHVGSRPTWYETWIFCEWDTRSACSVVALVSEAMEPSALAGTTASLDVNGAPGACTRVMDTAHYGIEFSCPFGEPGTSYALHLTSDVIATPDGALDWTHTVRSVETRGGPQHEVLDPRFGVEIANAAR